VFHQHGSEIVRLCRNFAAIAGLAGLVCLSACADPAPAMRDERSAVIPGSETAGLAQSDAVRKTLVLAANVTVDHGFRYFRIAGNASNAALIRPGADVIINVFDDGETSTKVAGVWDAEEILEKGPPNIPRSANVDVPPRRSPAAAPASTRSAPHCTAYGCDW
jgi:hypothetical protein